MAGPQRQAESQTDESMSYRKLFGLLLNAIPCSVLLVDRGLRVVSANSYFLEKSCLKPYEAANRHLREVFPEALLAHIDIPGQVNQAFESGAALRGQRITYRAPGIPVRFYYYSILPVFDAEKGGEPRHALIVMEDVTEQVRLSGQVQTIERKLANVVEHATDVILSTDDTLRVVTWNAAAERLTGYSAEHACGRPVLEFLAEAHRKDFENAFKAMNRSLEARMVYADLITNQGVPCSFSWVCSPLRSEQGGIPGMVAVGRDLTGSKQFEAQLLQSQKLAALGVMASGIAHELRNPLTLCSSGAQFLLEDEGLSPEFRRECAQQIKSGIERASLVIESLLRFARPQPDIEAEELDLITSLERSINLVANLAALQRIQISIDFAAGDVKVVGNGPLLEQVFVNLLVNAIDAMADGGKIVVSTTRNNGTAEVSIVDAGCGIPASEINKIFDPFYTGFRHKRGTGLGLAVSYSIVKQLQGEIEVHSLEGKGSTFIVVLPLSSR